MFVYLILINAAAFAFMCADKYFAGHAARRIPEKVLFLFAVLGGSAGCLLAMYLVRHKTRHTSFRWGIPILLIAHIILCVYWFT